MLNIAQQLESLKAKIDHDETEFDSSGEEDSVGHESNDWQSDTSETPAIVGNTRRSSLPPTPVQSKQVNASVHGTPLKSRSAWQSVCVLERLI